MTAQGAHRAPLQLQILQPARAVADAVLVNVELVQYAQQQITGRHGLRGIGQMTPAFESPVQSSDQHVRHIVVKVLIGVPHVAAIQNQ